MIYLFYILYWGKVNMDYGDGSYASHLSEFLEGLDEPVNNWFRCYSVFTLEKKPKAHVKTLQQDLKKKNNKSALKQKAKGF